MLNTKESKSIIANLPPTPGIYKMIDESGRVIYLGKAKNIRKRVSQYFQKDYAHSTRTKKMVEQIAKIETIVVDTELEAIILETNLIKQLLPKYNILMKDDKNYVYIRITKEDFPRIQLVRKIEKDKAKYFGPKTATHKVKETLTVLKKIFPFRHCNLEIACTKENDIKISNKVIKYPCLDYYIKRCIGPCINKCTKEEYAKIIENVENFLEGKVGDIIKNLQQEMLLAANDKKFEKAAKIRDKIKKIEDILEKQKVSDPTQKDKDIINYCIIREKAYFNLFQIRDGKLIGQENFILQAAAIEENSENTEVLEAFMQQYYQLATDIPSEILIPHEIENQSSIERLIEKDIGKKAHIVIPQKGIKNKLLEMSLNNAKIYADRNKPAWQEESELTIKSAEELGKVLNLPTTPKRIECYDISHLSGTDTVGSMVVFENGAPSKTMYRKFTLRTLNGKIDDFKSMEEVLIRRLSKITTNIKEANIICKRATKKDLKVLNEEENSIIYLTEDLKSTIKIVTISDKIVAIKEIDNFKDKLLKYAIDKIKSKRIYAAFTKKTKETLLLFGFEEIKRAQDELMKEGKNWLVYDKNKHKTDTSFTKIPDLLVIDGGKGQLQSCINALTKLNLKIPHISLAKRLEEIYTPGNSNPIRLAQNSEALKLLQRARDEAHRFAITFNRELRGKRLLNK